MPIQNLAVMGANPRPLLSQDNAPIKLPNVLGYTCDWGVYEHYKIRTP